MITTISTKNSVAITEVAVKRSEQKNTTSKRLILQFLNSQYIDSNSRGRNPYWVIYGIILKLYTHAVHKVVKYTIPAIRNITLVYFILTKSLTITLVRNAIERTPTQRHIKENIWDKEDEGTINPNIPNNPVLNISACSLSDAKPNTL